MTIGWYSYQQQPGRTPVCQASLTTTKSSEYSNSTAVGFESVRRHFVALQTPASSYVASKDRQHDPVQRSANKATCSTERTALVRPRQIVCIASHRIAPSEHVSHRSSAKRHWLLYAHREPARAHGPEALTSRALAVQLPALGVHARVLGGVRELFGRATMGGACTQTRMSGRQYTSSSTSWTTECR